MKRTAGLASLLISLFILHTSHATTLYVSPKGDDTNDGMTVDAPLKSISKAQQKARSLEDVTVMLRGGLYFMDAPLVFTANDSGTEDHPTTYQAYENEKPVLSGGVLIVNQFEEVKPGLFQTHIDEVENGAWYFYQLFVDGKRMIRARTPNEGFFNMVGQMRLEGPAFFTFHEGDIKKEWAGRGDVDVIGLAKWAEIRMPIVEVDEEKHTATLTKQVPPSNWRGAKDPRYWIENAPEALDQSGEWRLDKKTGMLSIMLEPGQNPNNMQIIAPKQESIIRFDGKPDQEAFVKNVSLNGITFAHTIAPNLQEGYPDMQAAFNISAAVSANGAQHVQIENCEFSLLGNYAVEFAQGCSNNKIVGNLMHDLGAGGVKIGEPAMREGALRTHHNMVTDNTIHHIGEMYQAAVGIWVGQSDNNTLAHNHIHHTYYTGLSVGWTWGV